MHAASGGTETVTGVTDASFAVSVLTAVIYVVSELPHVESLHASVISEGAAFSCHDLNGGVGALSRPISAEEAGQWVEGG